MKEKMMGSINYILGIISGIAVIVLLCLPLVTYTSNIDLYQGVSTYNGFQLLNVSFSYFNGTNIAMLSGIFAIITTVLAAVLIFVSLMMILKKFGAYDWKFDSKVSDFDMIFDAFSSIFAVFAFGVFLCATFFKGANQDLNNFFMDTTIAAILLFAIPVALAIVMWVIDTVKESKAKKAVAE